MDKSVESFLILYRKIMEGYDHPDMMAHKLPAIYVSPDFAAELARKGYYNLLCVVVDKKMTKSFRVDESLKNIMNRILLNEF